MPRVQLFRAALLALLAAFTISLQPAPAQAAPGSVKAYKPVARSGATLIFRVSGVKPARVAAARLRVGRSVRKVRAARVRAAVARRQTVRLRVLGGRRKARRLQRRTRLVLRTASGARVASSSSRPPARSCPEAYGSFSATNRPPGCWRPYGDSSPFNLRLPANPVLAPNSSAMVRTVTGWGGPDTVSNASTETGGDWLHPIYYSKPSDPVYTVHCTKSWGRCEVEGARVRIPAAARPAAGGDAHLTVIDQTGNWEYDFWQVKSKTSGRIEISWGGMTRIGTPDADGLGSNATAGNYGALAGLIRAQELAAGRIDHALFMSVKCASGQKVFPSQGTGLKCSSGAGSAPTMGSRFFLDMSEAEIEALNAPRLKKTILHAMAEYGMYVGDTGARPWAVAVESGTSYTSFGQDDPLERMFSKLPHKEWEGHRYVDIASGVNWAARLKVAAPCTANRTC